ncbi:hypothetical protein AGMMS50276_05260 [Synergistales bacterium]|nr:hypothetical protein AGMMS50276_05260 [Synergistales bacterium]
MARKRKMVQYNLLKNSTAAYFAAIEIHNKPHVFYRYETATLLIMNAWELLLKAFIWKFIKNRSIYDKDGHTISLDKALDYVSEHLNIQKPKCFFAIRANIQQIKEYRDKIVHYYNEQLTPYIFMLIARCALNYVEFMREYFSKDIVADEELFIMPLGFKLPFKPEDFLSRKAPAYTSSVEARNFIDKMISITTELENQGVSDSIVLGFNIYLESVKKIENSDLLVALTGVEEADTKFAKITNVHLTDDPSAQIVHMSDEQFRNIWKYDYDYIVNWCKENISGFKQGNLFNGVMRKIKEDVRCAYKRRLDSRNPKSASKDFYTEYALEQIKSKYYEEQGE